jgi:hypothetical protein
LKTYADAKAAWDNAFKGSWVDVSSKKIPMKP